MSDEGPSARVGLLPPILAGLAACNFLGIALTRALNFDESLALRAGWLLWERLPARPHFLMPWTLAMGLAAQSSLDPGVLLPLLRAAAAVGMLGALGWCLSRSATDQGEAALAALLTLCNGAFLLSGLELRYDLAVTLAWLLAFSLLSRPDRRGAAALGMLAALLALHHWKGVCYGGALTLIAGWTLRRDRRALGWLVGAALTTLLLWAGLVVALGMGDELLALYVDFAQVSLDAKRVAPWEALGPRLLADLPWWLAALPGLVLALRRADPLARLAAAFAAVPLGFALIHPNAWDYMLAPVAPFAALLAARGWLPILRRARRAWPAGLVLGGLLLGTALPASIRAWQSPLRPQVEALRLLRAEARPGETVFDPAGLAWFLPPSEPEWYLDTLFRPALERGDWMADSVQGRVRADWLIYSYRLEWLPKTTTGSLIDGYSQACGGVWLRTGDERLPRLSAACRRHDRKISSYRGR